LKETSSDLFIMRTHARKRQTDHFGPNAKFRITKRKIIFFIFLFFLFSSEDVTHFEKRENTSQWSIRS
jgi:hypothetical protein